MIQFEASDRRNIIAVGIEKQAFKKGGRRFHRWRITRPQTPEDFDDPLFTAFNFVSQQRVAQIRAGYVVVDKQNFKTIDATLAQFGQFVFRQGRVGFNHNLTCRLINNVGNHDLFHQFFGQKFQGANAGLFHLAN